MNDTLVIIGMLIMIACACIAFLSLSAMIWVQIL